MVVKGNTRPKLPLRTNITQTTAKKTTTTVTATATATAGTTAGTTPMTPTTPKTTTTVSVSTPKPIKRRSKSNPPTPENLERSRRISIRQQELQKKQQQENEKQEKEKQRQQQQKRKKQQQQKQQLEKAERKKLEQEEKRKQEDIQKRKLEDEKKRKQEEKKQKDGETKKKKTKKRKAPTKGYVQPYSKRVKAHTNANETVSRHKNKTKEKDTVKKPKRSSKHQTGSNEITKNLINRVLKAKIKGENKQKNLERRTKINAQRERGEQLSPEDEQYIKKFERDKRTKQKWQEKQKKIVQTPKKKSAQARYQHNYTKYGPLRAQDAAQIRDNQTNTDTRFSSGSGKREKKRKKRKQQDNRIQTATTTTTTTSHTSSTSVLPEERVMINGMIIDRTNTNSNGEIRNKMVLGDIAQFQKMIREFHNLHTCRFKVHKGNCDCTCIKNFMNSANLDIDTKAVIHLKEDTAQNNIGIAMIISSDASSNQGDTGDLVNETWLFNNVLNAETEQHTRTYSMAQCGLGTEKNAFVCIAGTDSFIKKFIDESSKKLKEKKAKGIELHRDSCIHLVRVAVVDLTISNFFIIRNKLTAQGMDVNILQRYQSMVIGPHLRSAMRSDYFNYEVDGESAKVLVMIKFRQARVPAIILDIPGGKRELGETSVDCAVREVYEEVHISLDRQMLENGIIDDGVEDCGRFYFVRD